MSLYNQLFGTNAFMPVVVADVFGISIEEKNEATRDVLINTLASIPRFRDAFINKNKELVIYTRTGGGNRPYFEMRVAGVNDDYKGLFNSDLRKIPGYVRDYDDKEDATFASFIFTPKSAEVIEMLTAVDPSIYTAKDPEERFLELIAAMKNPNPDPANGDLRRATAFGEKLAATLKDKLDTPPDSNSPSITEIRI